MAKLIITEAQFEALQELYGKDHRNKQPENDENLDMAFLHNIFKKAKPDDMLRIRHIGDLEKGHHGAYEFKVEKKTRQFLYLTSAQGQFKNKYFYLKNQPFDEDGSLEIASRDASYTTKKNQTRQSVQNTMQAINTSQEAQEVIRYFYNWYSTGSGEEKEKAAAFFKNPKKYQATAYKNIEPNDPQLVNQSRAIKFHIVPIVNKYGAENFKQAAFRYLRVPITEELMMTEEYPSGAREQTFQRIRDIQLFRGGKPIGEVVVDNTLDIHMEKTKSELRSMNSDEVMKFIVSQPELKKLFYRAPTVWEALRNKDPKTLATVHKLLGNFWDKKNAKKKTDGEESSSWTSRFRKGDKFDIKDKSSSGREVVKDAFQGLEVKQKSATGAFHKEVILEKGPLTVIIRKPVDAKKHIYKADFFVNNSPKGEKEVKIVNVKFRK